MEQSNLATATITTAGSVLGAMAVVKLKAAGYDLVGQELAIAGLMTLGIGAAAGWVTAIIDSFVKAVVALNDAFAARAGQIVDKIAGKQS